MSARIKAWHWDAAGESIAVLLVDDDGVERTEVIDDLSTVRHWGDAAVFEFAGRDPVIIRPDGEVLPLISG